MLESTYRNSNFTFIPSTVEDKHTGKMELFILLLFIWKMMTEKSHSSSSLMFMYNFTTAKHIKRENKLIYLKWTQFF